MGNTDWNLRFMQHADEVATWSKDKSTKVGAVIVADNNPISVGFNGFPRKVNEDIPERHERPTKYLYTIHAETNAIINAARHGQKTNGADMYVNWFPCARCAGAIVNAGIKRVFCDKEPDWNSEEGWISEQKIALEIMNEGKVEIVYMNFEAHRK